jgi:hypothetical protein
MGNVLSKLNKKMPKNLLELFAGTKSVSKTVGGKYDNVVSVDILNTFKPTHVNDIMTWDYRQYPTGHFHTIWASPPCTQYSKAKTRGARDLAGANAIVQRTIEIIEYFNPDYWFIENPQTGKLKDQDFMDMPYYDVDYCQYGKLYRKRTRIWTNLDNFVPRLCGGAGVCTAMDGRKHRLSIGNGNPIYTEHALSLHDKYSIPPLLLQALFATI